MVLFNGKDRDDVLMLRRAIERASRRNALEEGGVAGKVWMDDLRATTLSFRSKALYTCHCSLSNLLLDFVFI